MSLTVDLRPQDNYQCLKFTNTDNVFLNVPENTGQFPMGFTVFLVSTGVDSVEVQPDTLDVDIASYNTVLTNGNDIGVLTNLNGLNNWRFNITSPSQGTNINEQALTGTKVLTASDAVWQVLNPNGADRDVNITSTSLGSEFVIVNDGTTDNLLIKELGTLVATLIPGDSFWAKRATTKWVGLKFNSYV